MRLDELRYFDPYEEITQTENRLPHWEQSGKSYFVTFRLADAVPNLLLDRWHEDRAAWLSHHPEPWIVEIEREYHTRFSAEMERWMDAGHGACVLKDPRCAQIVGDALAYFEGTRCTQIAWVVMPNHVHVLFTLHEPFELKRLIGSWKQFSAREINLLLGQAGELWQRDYFDRLIRDEVHFWNCIRYIRRNAAKARLRPGEYILWESDLAKVVE